MRGVSGLVGAAAIAAVICTSASAGVVKGGNGNGGNSDSELVPTGKGWGERPADFQGQHGQANGLGNGQAGKNNNGISYHGGPLITSATGPTVYYIWYGNWTGNSAVNLLQNLATNIGGSPYFNINTTYYDGGGNKVVNNVSYGGAINDNYTQGSSLTDSKVQAIVGNALTANKLKTDTNAVYFVLTSSDVNETSGFCTQYCGWHTHAILNGSDIKYAFVGNPDRCPSACEEQTTSPSGNAGADGMASIIAHELEEATTDPDLNAWYDVRGQENADKCAWTFGATSTAANGSMYNVTLNGTQYLIQRNWVNASGGYCALSY